MSFPFSFWKFDPRSVAGLAHWFEADYGVTDDGAGRAASVLDRSGTGNTLTGAGGAGNPTRRTGGSGGRPFFQFQSVNSQQFSVPGILLTGNTFYTAVVLQGAAAGSVVEVWTHGAVANIQVSCSNANGGINCFEAGNLVNSNPQDVSTVPGLIEVRMNAGTAAMWYNGLSLTMANPAGFGGGIVISSIGLLLTFFSDMSLYGGMWFTTLPSATQQLQLREYWRSKYALF